MTLPESQSLFLAILAPAREGLATDPSPEERTLLMAHFELLQKAASEGRVLMFGRTTDEATRPPMGLVLFRAEDAIEAEAWMAEDPVMKAGLMHYEIRPYRIAGGAPGLVV